MIGRIAAGAEPRPLAPLLPLPIWAQRRCTPTRGRPTCNVQRATFQLLSPLAPRLAPSRHCSRCRSGRSAAAPLHVVVPRATCNVQPSTPRASRLSPLAPLLPLPVRAPRRCAPTRGRPTCNVQRSTFNPSRLSPLAPPRPTACRGRWHGTAPQDPHTAAIPPASGYAAGGGRTRRSGPSGVTTTPVLCHPHSR
jgi:hypothetical protein